MKLPALPPLDRNGRLVLVGKAFRAFGFGLNSIVLGLYLDERGLDPAQIGVVLAAALVGTALLTLVIALFGDRLGRRRVLVAGGLLMLLSLFVPIVGADPLLLVVIALSGMVAVTANENTGLQSLDQAILPQTTDPGHRTAVFALYGLTASLAVALGGLAVGPLVALGSSLGLAGADRFTPSFVVYAFAGVATVIAARAMNAAAEPTMPEADVGAAAAARRRFGIQRSRRPVLGLSLLFGLDAFAGGLIVQSFLAIWFSRSFGLDPATIGLLFFAGNLLAAASYPAAAWLSARIGLIRTMVFTHIPSSILLMAMTVVPMAPAAALLFLGRAAISSMDVPARQSYTMAIVDPAERTATAGVTSLARSIASSAGPLLTAALVPLGLGAPLVACGLLKIGYDVLLYGAFRTRPAPEEVSVRPAG
ncbi:MAG: MFS transporter [Candidatus Limnocylindrales bacterium]